ncbi:hypothetical protein [uncultured Shewanella sp.]|uniref:hypothetical protein n=1 Tax=uncultured Shewanella sp. TaxID=173975 RepID=UPI0026192446|nr:hypothetical protein [uncultured Shewanella sp.]
MIKLTGVMLSFLLFFGFSHVIAKECHLPEVLSNKRILLEVDLFYQPSNPDAGGLKALTFSGNIISDITLETGENNQGTFQYTRLKPYVAVLKVALNQGPKMSESEITLVCDTPLTGLYIYTQVKGSIKPDLRHNLGSYMITNKIDKP